MSDLILYTSENGQTRMRLRAEGKTVWLSQSEIAELFLTIKNYVSIYNKHIFEEGELTAEATVKQSLTVQSEGGRDVKRSIEFFNLDLILAISFRVRSPRGTHFRQWATTHLRGYIVKGFVMDDERSKNPSGWDYSDNLAVGKSDLIEFLSASALGFLMGFVKAARSCNCRCGD